MEGGCDRVMLQLQEIISPPDDRYILYAAIAALWLRNKVLEDRWLALREVLDEFTHALRDWTIGCRWV